jgi:SAM-dependent methyltransferase
MKRMVQRAFRRAHRDFTNFRIRHLRRFPRHLVASAQHHAEALSVNPEIHGADFMFWVMYEAPGRMDRDSAVSEYFASGRSNALDLTRLLANHIPDGEFDLLDFASGYVRVARHFPEVCPRARLTVSDIHPKAIRFARRIGLRAVPSTWVPERYRPGTFDAITTVSFFTHMPRDVWARWLEALSRALKPGGILLFTTHGEAALPHMGVREVEPDGFLFFHHTEQKDLSIEKYGATATMRSFVERAIDQAGLTLVEALTPGLGFHDVYIVRRV